MNPREILEELDNSGSPYGTSTWGTRDRGPFHIEIAGRAPEELQAEIRRNNDELLKVAAWEPGRAPGIRFRKPR